MDRDGGGVHHLPAAPCLSPPYLHTEPSSLEVLLTVFMSLNKHNLF